METVTRGLDELLVKLRIRASRLNSYDIMLTPEAEFKKKIPRNKKTVRFSPINTIHLIRSRHEELEV